MTLSNESIMRLIEGYEKESRALKDEALRMSWYMRGGLTYDDAMMLDATERDLISKLIKENLEITKASKMPFF